MMSSAANSVRFIASGCRAAQREIIAQPPEPYRTEGAHIDGQIGHEGRRKLACQQDTPERVGGKRNFPDNVSVDAQGVFYIPTGRRIMWSALAFGDAVE